MASAIPQGRLEEAVRAARARTDVPAVVAGLRAGGHVELAADGPVDVDTPFRIASVTKLFTASLATLLIDLGEPIGGVGAAPRQLLSHTAGLRSEVAAPLPEACRGLWSYANSGYWAVGHACAAAAGSSFAEAIRARILEPLGMEATSFEEPAGAAAGHVQEGETGHRRVASPDYPEARYPSGGLWATVGDLLRFAAHQLGGDGPLSAEQRAALREPQAEALGASYCLGCWRRGLEGGRVAFDHEGSVAGYQSLLLLVPEQDAALVVLTNSWRGSGLIRRVVKELGLVPPVKRVAVALDLGRTPPIRFALGETDAIVERVGHWRVRESETDPLTGVRTERPAFRIEPLGDGVYGAAGGLLMSHRVDFPRENVARIGWTALPRA